MLKNIRKLYSWNKGTFITPPKDYCGGEHILYGEELIEDENGNKKWIPKQWKVVYQFSELI